MKRFRVPNSLDLKENNVSIKGWNFAVANYNIFIKN